MHNPNTQQGFSYIEMVIVVVILGIVVRVAMPNLSSTDPVKLDNAANEIANAIKFAQAEAARTKIPYGINTDVANDRIRVYSLPGTTPIYDIYHPVDKKLYDIQLKTNAYVAGVDLVSASFAFSGAASSTANLDFSAEGIPKVTSSGADYMLISGTITLGYHGQQRVIVIAPMTGRVGIQ
uniref:pilus assembly FimT family protein n=1 Tax=Crenothrix polyspora TaxID=360316 RepID=UPI0015C5957E|nr:GspH/FimT family pseudopilin [Crenothrix polyspora]